MKLVTFNILSSELANPEWFKNSSEEHLDSAYRFNKIRDILTTFIDQKYIICLQEVSTEWDQKIREFILEIDNYHYISDLRHKKLGLGICIPDNYNVRNIHKISLNENIKNFYSNPEVPEEIRLAKEEPRNVLILELDTFFIANIHMPCKFTMSLFMEIYTLSLMEAVNHIVGKSPMMLVGDFNSTYLGNGYKILTEGIKYGKNYELLKNNISDENCFDPFIDAQGDNHTTTCIACQNGENVPFIIDYIFYRDLTINSIEVLGTDISLPSQTHPSDHFPIICDFDLK